MVLNGQRLPGPKLEASLVRYFAFDKKAAAYFRGLIALERARSDPEAYEALAARLEASRPKGAIAYLDDAAFEILASWHYYALRELTQLAVFDEDPAWLAARLGGRVGPHQCREALQRLQAAGLLARDAAGRLRPTTASVHAGNSGLKNLAVRRYHAAALDSARRALTGEPVERRLFAASTLSVKAGAVDVVRGLIERFQDDLARAVEASPGGGDEVYQLTVQFVPLTATRDGAPPDGGDDG